MSLYVVDSLADGPINDPPHSPMTLREAIHEANANPGSDEIQFAPALAGGTIPLWGIGMELVVSDDLTIIGLGKDQLTIDGQDQTRHFEINAGVSFSLRDITLDHGSAGEGNPGGSILADGTVTLTDVILSNNRAGQDGGAIFGTASCPAIMLDGCTVNSNLAINLGGGIATLAGTLNLNSTSFADNQALTGGGVCARGAGSVTVLGGSFERNTANADGGGIDSARPTAIVGTTFTDNHASASTGDGGGIRSANTLTIADASFDGNDARYGGGLYATGTAPATLTNVNLAQNSADYGGAIFVDGYRPCELFACSLGDNEASVYGGAVYVANAGSLVSDGTSFDGNIATEFGGAIFSYGALLVRGDLTTSVFSNNRANLYDGGALYCGAYSTSTVIEGTRFASNTAQRFGGAMRFTGGTFRISGSDFELNTAVTGSGGALFNAMEGAIASTRFNANQAGGDGGAIYTGGDDFVLTIDGCVLENNIAGTDGTGSAGAIRSFQRRLELRNSTVRNNTAASDGGGLYITEGLLAVTNTLIAGNSAGDQGGGMMIWTDAELSFCNSTISGNTAVRDAGGLYLNSLVNTATFVNATIAGNRADTNGTSSRLGGGIFTGNANVLLQNTIVAGNVRGTGSTPSDIEGAVLSASTHSAIQDPATAGGLVDGVNGNLVGHDPRLGPLSDNGGRSHTHALLGDSPAIDAGDNSLALAPDGEPLWYDQRGYDFDRLVGLYVDMGAYELRKAGGEIHGRKWFDLDQDGEPDEPWGASIVVNGGFEGSLGSGKYTGLYAGNATLGGWRVLRFVQSINDTYSDPAEGHRFMDLNGSDAGAIAQTLATEPGRRYRVSFHLAGLATGGHGLKKLRVSAADEFEDFTFDTTGRSARDMGWQSKTFYFTAQDLFTTLVFESRTPGTSYGPAVDNVVVAPFGRDDVRVYLDSNDSGGFDPGEPLTFLRQDDPNTPAVDETCTYRFTGLPDDSYVVRELLAAGFEQVAPVSPGSHDATIVGGQVLEGLDFGNRWDGRISGTKFVDNNNNGIRDRNPLPADAPAVLMVLDVSDSASRPAGFTVADQNSHAGANDLLDAEIYAMLQVQQELITLQSQWGASAQVGVVVFAAQAVQLDMDPEAAGIQPFISPTAVDAGGGNKLGQLLRSLRPVHTGTSTGNTDYEAALQSALQTLAAQPPSGDTVMFFVSDGLSNNPWVLDDELAQLDALNVKRTAWGLGDICNVAGLRRIDPFAEQLHSTTEIYQKATARSRAGVGNGQWLEPGLPDVTIYLDLDEDGALSSGDVQTVTRADDAGTAEDETGWYSFDGLPIGTYTVREVVPAGYVQTAPLNPEYYTVNLRSEPLASGYDFGNRRTPGCITGNKRLDADYNGVYDPGEPGQAGVTIYLDLDNNGRWDGGEPKTVTDANGQFSFPNLSAGTYFVREETPVGFDQVVPASGQPITVTLEPEETVSDCVFVNQDLRGCIFGFKWVDLNGNGQREANEPGLEGVRVYLDLDGDGVWDGNEPYGWTQSDDPATVGVDERGAWKIENVVPSASTYTVREVSSAGYVTGFPPSGSHQVLVGSRAVVDRNTTGVLLGFGNVPLAPEIDGWKYDDANQNGRRDRNRCQGDLLVLAIDLSDSTRNPYGGAAPGDVNGDGSTGDVLDGELAALIAVNQELISRGINISVTIVALADQGYPVDLDPTDADPSGIAKSVGFPTDDVDGDGVPDVEQVLRSLVRADFGSALRTNYAAALETVADTIVEIDPATGATLLFVSDGNPNNYDYDNEVANLRDMEVSLNAFGAGSTSYLWPLQKINADAERFTDPDDLVQKFFGAASLSGGGGGSSGGGSADGLWLEPGLPNVVVYLDADNDGSRDWTDGDGDGKWDLGEGERWTVTESDNPATPDLDETGYYRFDNLAPGTYFVREIVRYGWQAVPLQPACLLDDSLVSGFEFSGNTIDAVRGEAAANHGAVLAADRFAQGNAAYFFDGADWITADSGALPLGNEPRTLTAWVRSADGRCGSTADHIVGWGLGGSGQGFGLMLFSGDQWWAWLHGTPPNFTSGMDADLSWHQLVITHDGTTVRLYVDGMRRASASRTLDTTADLFTAGTSPNLLPTNTFDGEVDDIRVYNRELTAADIAALYDWENQRTTCPDAHIVRVAYGDVLSDVNFGDVLNQPPALDVTAVVTTLPEDHDTAMRLKVADITLTDDGLGTNSLSLSGPQAAMFEIDGAAVYLKAGAALDFETNQLLEVTLVVNDVATGSTPDDSRALSIAVTNVNDVAPQVVLSNQVTVLTENSPTTPRIKVADIAVIDDGLGTNDLALTGEDVDLFEIDGDSLYLKAGVALDFETNPSFDVTVTVDDAELGSTPDDSEALSIALDNVNDVGPVVVLSNKVTTLVENSSTTPRIKVADIAVIDDGAGLNLLWPSGADAALFEIDGSGLYLKAGTALDLESNPRLDVTVDVDDSTGSTTDYGASMSITVGDVNDVAPQVVLSNRVTSLVENAATTPRIKVADIAVIDDALGNDILSLGGADAGLFEIGGSSLYLRAGTALDFETNPVLDVTVSVDDPTLGTTPDDSEALSIEIGDANDPPAVALANVLAWLPENTNTTNRTKVADVTVIDDALGTHATSLSGPDAWMFQLVDEVLYLKSGILLNRATNPALDVTIAVDDPNLGTAPDDAESLSIAVTPPVDLRIQTVTLDGDTGLTLTYQVVGGSVTPFEIGFHRSSDTAFGDDVLSGSVPIDASGDCTAGIHTKTFTIGSGPGQIALPAAGAAEVDADYFLLAVADTQNRFNESAFSSGETNNTAVMGGVYHAAGGPVMVHGIGTRDVITISPITGPQTVQVDFNGSIRSYAVGDLTGVRVRAHNGSDEFQLRIDSGFGSGGTLNFLFNGGAGTNTAKVWGSTSTTAKDVARINPMTGTFLGPGYTLSWAGMRGITVNGQGGPDEAYIYDSSLSDTFTAYPTYVTLSNSLYTNRAEAFRNVFAYAQVGGAYMPAGGADVAHFYGIDGKKDYFRASAMYGIMADAETGRGSTYFVRGNWFEQVHAYGLAASGRPSNADRDQAMLYDAATTDLFEAATATALATYAYSGASTVNAHAFRVVKAYGGPGDTANLYGPGTYTPGENPVMYTSDFTVWANGFDPINWHPDGPPSALSSRTAAAAVDAALPLMFGDDASISPVRKKIAASVSDRLCGLW